MAKKNKLKKSDFSNESFDKAVVESLNARTDTKSINETMNFYSSVVHDYDKNLSIVGKYRRYGQYVRLNTNLDIERCVADDFYYGVSPELDNNMIIEAISKLNLSNMTKVECFVRNNAHLFMLHQRQQKYMLPFAFYSILAYSSVFGIRLLVSDGDILNKLEGNDFGWSVEIKGKVQNKSLVILRGCPIDEVIKIFKDARFKKCDIGETNISCWEMTNNGVSLKEIYSIKDNILLLDKDVFYSGVLVRVLKFKIEDYIFENIKTTSLVFDYERSSFATVFALDNDYTNHPLLGNNVYGFSSGNRTYRDYIHDLFIEDDIQKEKLINHFKDHPDECLKDKLDILNEYLKHSHNVNQIAVAANVISSDGYLLLGRRSKDVVDAGCLYTSVNGNAEIKDDKVSFYSYAIQDDYPTIDISDTVTRFNSEIKREFVEELGCSAEDSLFMCCLLALVGNELNNIEYGDACIKKRRLHFNIFYEYKSDKTLEELKDCAKKANESFENEDFVGLKVSIHKNWFSTSLNIFKGIAHKLAESKDLLEAILIVVAAIAYVYANKNVHEFDMTKSEIVTLVVAIFVIISKLLDFISVIKNWCKMSKVTSSINIYISNEYNDLLRRINTNKYIKINIMYPIARASIQHFVEKRVFEAITSENRHTK